MDFFCTVSRLSIFDLHENPHTYKEQKIRCDCIKLWYIRSRACIGIEYFNLYMIPIYLHIFDLTACIDHVNFSSTMTPRNRASVFLSLITLFITTSRLKLIFRLRVKIMYLVFFFKFSAYPEHCSILFPYFDVIITSNYNISVVSIKNEFINQAIVNFCL